MPKKTYKPTTKKHDTGPAVENFNKKIDDEHSTVKSEKREVNKDFKTKKRLNVKVAEACEQLGKKALKDGLGDLAFYWFNKSNVIKACDNYTLFAKCHTHKKVHVVYKRFCKQRLCPVCNYNRSLQNKKKLTKLFDWMYTQEDYKYNKYYHLTLTVPNIAVDFNNIEDALKLVDAMFRAWTDISQHHPFFTEYYPKHPDCNLRKKKTCQLECQCVKDGKCNISNMKGQKPCINGTIKAFEVTLNLSFKRGQWEIHPHFHIVLSVTPAFHYGKRILKKPHNRGWGVIWEEYLNKHIDVKGYRDMLWEANKGKVWSVSKKRYLTYEEYISEPLQAHVDAIYDKTVKKEDYLKHTKQAHEKDIKTLDEQIDKMKCIDKAKLKAIQKELSEIDGKPWKYDTTAQAVKAWEKDFWNGKGGVKEVAKYAHKDSDVVKLDKDGNVKQKDTIRSVFVFDKVLSGRRLLTLSGSFKEAAEYLKIKISDEVDDEKDEDDSDCKMIFKDGKFVCDESGSVMDFVMTKFNMESQIYEELLEGEEIRYLAERVLEHWQKNEDKKNTDASSQT